MKVLFVCLGNICRSPTADAVFNKMVSDSGLNHHVHVDSAGTGSWHVGHPPDKRATEVAAQRGYDLSLLRARQVCLEDFDQFDHILAMDKANLSDLAAMCPPHCQDKLRLFLEFAPDLAQNDVADPYYGGNEGFDLVLDMVEA
ncbi:MAG: low molecular weight phosphotyrosine protein phosphatase, partial [Pseudomonadales bacterium]|nr:low molecular weight phosphotyrosine protein phosphatase [Pseudomonadales bacterium]